MFGFYPHKRCLYFVLFNGQSLQQRNCIDSFYALFIATFLVFFILKASSGHFTGSSFMCFLRVEIFKRIMKGWFLVLFTLSPSDPIHSHKLPISNRKILKSCLLPKVCYCTYLPGGPPSPSSLSQLCLLLPALSASCILNVSPSTHHLQSPHLHLDCASLSAPSCSLPLPLFSPLLGIQTIFHSGRLPYSLTCLSIVLPVNWSKCKTGHLWHLKIILLRAFDRWRASLSIIWEVRTA